MAGYEQLSRAELLGVLAERDREIAELRAEIAGLAARLVRLERLVSRNNGNSSVPPSSDDVLPGRGGRQGSPARGSGARGMRGKQQGAEGRWLPWAEAPDKTVCHRPAGRCGCGADLARAAGVRVECSHQVHDLPRAAVEVTQHDVWRVRCGCGRESMSARCRPMCRPLRPATG